jgi:uncharacterized membrane protein
MKELNRIFFKGLILLLPIGLTFYFLFWVSASLEALFGSVVQLAVGEALYIPGTGIVLTVLLVFLVGLLAHNYFTNQLFRWFTGKLEQFPLIKVIYNPLRDLMALLPNREQGQSGQKVVLVDLQGVQVMGLVTREGLAEIAEPGLVSVYVPFSYMLGGMTVLVPADKVRKVDVPVDQAIKLSVTAWIKKREKED